ncbi:MAG: thioredoxin family protein [Bacteroidales bacterium]|nr:thioredoxin family protein [Bacteroidales bacterium]
MKHKFLLIILILLSAPLFMNMGEPISSKEKEKDANHLVTFIELGSVRCIPCKKMEPILKSIRKKYPEDVKVVFHDVWTEKGEPYATKYKVKKIPTQIFLDKEGKEYFRHEGFLPEDDVLKVLRLKGVKK